MSKRTWILWLLLLSLVPALCAAEKLYHYDGENGTPTFSDRPLDQGTLKSVAQIAPQDYSFPFELKNTGSERRPIISGWNGSLAPLEIEIRGKELKNARTRPRLPLRTVLPPQKEIDLFRVLPLNPQRTWSYGYEAEAVIGDPSARHLPPAPYLPPFEEDGFYRITQAYPSRYTHSSAQSWHAVDIAMPEGTPVCAARAGVVVEVAQDFINGGVGETYESRANFIRILHDDGTMAVYAHLQLESVRVLTGNRVEAGQIVAHSGNTGFSTGPHLHFVVQLNQGMELVSIPIEFSSGPPVEGQWLER